MHIKGTVIIRLLNKKRNHIIVFRRCCSHLRIHTYQARHSTTAVIDFPFHLGRLWSLWSYSRWYFTLVFKSSFPSHQRRVILMISVSANNTCINSRKKWTLNTWYFLSCEGQTMSLFKRKKRKKKKLPKSFLRSP